MRRFLTLATSLVLAGCATAPTPEQPAPIPPSEHTRGEIVGMTAEQLVGHFSTPALQIREGESLKLQFRSPQCVLDAYLYPNGSSGYRATYVDTRTPGLAPIDQALCIRSLEAR